MPPGMVQVAQLGTLSFDAAWMVFFTAIVALGFYVLYSILIFMLLYCGGSCKGHAVPPGMVPTAHAAWVYRHFMLRECYFLQPLWHGFLFAKFDSIRKEAILSICSV